MSWLDLGGRMLRVEQVDFAVTGGERHVRATLRGFVEVTVPRAASLLTSLGWLSFEVRAVEHRRCDEWPQPALDPTYVTTVCGSCPSR